MSTIKVQNIQHTGSSTNAIALASDGTCTANITNNLSNRNVIVNGAMEVSQRSVSSSSADFASVDRMKMSVTGTDQLAFLQKQTSDAPDGFSKCFEFDVTTAESALDPEELVYIRYAVESQTLIPFFNADGTGKDFILSFYVKAYQAGTYQISIYKEDSTRFITKTYTIASSATWQRVEIPITGDTSTSGMTFDNTIGFQIAFQLAAGTNYTSGSAITSWGSWGGNPSFAAGQAVNVLSSTDNYFRITGIQLELDQGSNKATDYEFKTFAQELASCQRYFCKSYNYSVTAGTATFEGAIHGRNYDPNTGRSANPVFVYFPSRMRENPTMTFFAGDGQSNKYSTGSTVGGADLTGENTFGTTFINSESGIFHCDLGESVPAANLFAFQYTADAEL